MAKKRKSYNPLKFVRQNNERLLRNLAVAFFATDDSKGRDIDLVTIKGEKVNVTQTMADAIEKHPYMWSLMLGVFCVEKGVNTVKFELVKFTSAYYQRDLVHYLNERHQAFIDKQKAKSVKMTGAGWIASPVGRDFSEDEAGVIFEKLGAI